MKTTERNVFALTQALSGSGFDAAWTITENSRNIVAETEFHHMNEHGYYVRWIPVRLRFPKRRDMIHFRLETPNMADYCRYHMLRDYFEDCVAETIVTLSESEMEVTQ